MAGETNQNNNAVAIGRRTQHTGAGEYAVAIGLDAGKTNQGENAVAIGHDAGQTNQAATSIVINASGTTLDNTTANSLKIKPVRDVSGSLPSGFKQLAHNATTGEIISYG